MKKTLIAIAVALFLLATPVLAWFNCTIPSCPDGYTDNGTSCESSTCTRTCYFTSCDTSTWTEVHSDTSSIDWDLAGDAYEMESTSSYTPSTMSLCYKLTYDGPTASSNRINLDPEPDACSGTNCDTESIAFLVDITNNTRPWFENMNNTGWYDPDYLGITNPSHGSYNYGLKIMRAHDENTNNAETGQAYRDDVAITNSVYCAPSQLACDDIANNNSLKNCNATCYNHTTYLSVAQGYFEKTGSPDYTLFDDERAPNNDVFNNRMMYNGFYVYTAPKNKTVYLSQTCNRTNEAPSVSSLKTIPLNATAGDDLICNYTYSDPENFSEQNSSYEWWKDGVNQNIDDKTLGSSNLSVGDVWYCKVAPSDGLNSSSLVQSTNVTVLTTVSEIALYIEGQQAWQKSSYFSDSEFVVDFSDELQDALDSCTADAEGYCNISLNFSSSTEGRLNLSDVEVYYTDQIPPIEVTSLSQLDTNGTRKTFEFVIMNHGNITLTDVNWSINTSETVINSSENINLTASENASVFVRHNYGGTGYFTVNATVFSGNVSHSKNAPFFVGDLEVNSLAVLNSSGTTDIFRFLIVNRGSSNFTHVNWSLDTGETFIYANWLINLSVDEDMSVFVKYNYTSTGTFVVNATAINNTLVGYDNFTVTIT